MRRGRHHRKGIPVSMREKGERLFHGGALPYMVFVLRKKTWKFSFKIHAVCFVGAPLGSVRKRWGI